MDESWKQAVSDLLSSYEELGGLNHSDTHNMPSKRAVGTICEDLLRLLFPGFHDDDAVHKERFLDLTTERVAAVVENLQAQVRKSVRIGDPHRPTGRTRPILLKFCKDLPAIRRLLHTDIQTAYEGDPAALSRDEIILSYPFGPHPMGGVGNSLIRGCTKLGIGVSAGGPVAILSGSRGNRPHCIYRGFCIQGCKVGAKASTLITHVPDALDNGAEIRDRCMVSRIHHDKKRNRVFAARNIQKDHLTDSPTRWPRRLIPSFPAGTRRSCPFTLSPPLFSPASPWV
jgi:hypothetical protein